MLEKFIIIINCTRGVQVALTFVVTPRLIPFSPVIVNEVDSHWWHKDPRSLRGALFVGLGVVPRHAFVLADVTGLYRSPGTGQLEVGLALRLCQGSETIHVGEVPGAGAALLGVGGRGEGGGRRGACVLGFRITRDMGGCL